MRKVVQTMSRGSRIAVLAVAVTLLLIAGVITASVGAHAASVVSGSKLFGDGVR